MSYDRAAFGLRVGLDLVQVSRIEESIARFGDRFTARVFTPEELAYCDRAPAERTRRLAARFAAKEATWKALGLPDAGQPWTSVEVVHEEAGCSVRLHPPLAERARAAGVAPVSISITHEGDYAAAVVLASSPPPAEEEPHAQP